MAWPKKEEEGGSAALAAAVAVAAAAASRSCFYFNRVASQASSSGRTGHPDRSGCGWEGTREPCGGDAMTPPGMGWAP